MSSSHTKHHLEDLHPNIAVMRHPDHIGGEVTLYWSHHEKVRLIYIAIVELSPISEKLLSHGADGIRMSRLLHLQLVVVDNVYAAVGGLDLCFGRWDTHTFPLADVHPTDFDAT